MHGFQKSLHRCALDEGGPSIMEGLIQCQIEHCCCEKKMVVAMFYG